MTKRPAAITTISGPWPGRLAQAGAGASSRAPAGATGTNASRKNNRSGMERLGRAISAESPAKHCSINQLLKLCNITVFQDNHRVAAYYYNLHHKWGLTGTFRLHYNDFGRFSRIYQDEFVKIHPRKVFRGAKFADF